LIPAYCCAFSGRHGDVIVQGRMGTDPENVDRWSQLRTCPGSSEGITGLVRRLADSHAFYPQCREFAGQQVQFSRDFSPKVLNVEDFL